MYSIYTCHICIHCVFVSRTKVGLIFMAMFIKMSKELNCINVFINFFKFNLVYFQVASVKDYGIFVKIPGTTRQGKRYEHIHVPFSYVAL